MPVIENARVVLAKHPSGPVTPDCFRVESQSIGAPEHGDVLVRVIYVSVDPYLRGRIDRGGGFNLGDVIAARAVGQVVTSRHPQWTEGDLVWGFFGWQTHALVPRGEGLWRIDPSLGEISQFISVLGMPGLTAWVGMMELGRPQPGSTVVVSSAAGAVGSVAGQLARLAGARVIGVAGSPEKVRHVIDDLGFDECVSYKSATPLAELLARACPNGIDVYFDNVGGGVLDAVLANIAPLARIAVCGMISGYDTTERSGVRNLNALLSNRVTMTGFSIYDHMDKYAAFVPKIAALVRSGQVVFVQDIQRGIENVADAFIGLLRGDAIGKRLVQVGDAPQATAT